MNGFNATSLSCQESAVRLIIDSSRSWPCSYLSRIETETPHSHTMDQKEKAKRIRFLQCRGFSFDHINEVINDNGF